MELKLRNIGPISQADISFSGITVLCGLNGSGKSTVNKCLHTIYNFAVNKRKETEYKIRKELAKKVNIKISSTKKPADEYEFQDIHDKIRFYESDAVRKILTVITDSIYSNSILKNTEEQFKLSLTKQINENNLRIQKNYREDNLKESLEEVDELVKSSVEIYNSGVIEWYKNANNQEQFEKILLDKFNQNVCTNGAEKNSLITFIDGNCTIEAEIKNNTIINFRITDNVIAPQESIYTENFLQQEIDNKPLSEGPQAIETLAMINETLHYKFANELKHEKNFEKFDLKKKSYMAVRGDFTVDLFDNPAVEVVNTRTGLKIPQKNLSSGERSLLYLKHLILCDKVIPYSFLILDEPETRLHPAWQARLGEILVCLHRETGLPIIISTHSAYLLCALELYTHKQNIENAIDYYSTRDDGHGTFTFENDKDDMLNYIYSSLSEPLEELNREFYTDE